MGQYRSKGFRRGWPVPRCRSKPGQYKLSVGPLRSRDLDSLEYGYALTYYANSPERASATTVPLAAAQQAEVNFKIDMVRMYSVSGVVLAAWECQPAFSFLTVQRIPSRRRCASIPGLGVSDGVACGQLHHSRDVQ